jgi:hypothetical protein
MDGNLRTDVDWYSTLTRVSYLLSTLSHSRSKYLVPVSRTNGTPGDLVASGSSLVLPRAAADTRSAVHYTIHYTGASIAHSAMQGQQRGAQGAGEEERGEKEGRGNGGRGEGSRLGCWW